MSKIHKLIRLNTKKGPTAIGPYSTATIHRGVMYISGQIGIDPLTG
jgi:2-iminobutanoate/2-iminopropanoate deaminase